MFSSELFWTRTSCFLVAAFLCCASVAETSEQKLLAPAGKPAEGPLDVFLGEPFFDMQVARFNLSWVLQGERTGSGEVPQWVIP